MFNARLFYEIIKLALVVILNTLQNFVTKKTKIFPHSKFSVVI